MLCRCHNVAMRWTKDPRCRAGGHYICAVKARAAQREYARRKRAESVEYRVTQRLGRLRRLRGRTLNELSQLQGGQRGFES